MNRFRVPKSTTKVPCRGSQWRKLYVFISQVTEERYFVCCECTWRVRLWYGRSLTKHLSREGTTRSDLGDAKIDEVNWKPEKR